MYTKEYILESIKRDLMLYQRPEIQYRGKTKENENGSSELFTEVIAEYILGAMGEAGEDIGYLHLTSADTRQCFRFPSHDGQYGDKTNRKEEHFCKKLFHICQNGELVLETLGSVINYQVNLIENTNINIDLVSVSGKYVNIIEVKGHWNNEQQSKETLLRCMLEIESYYQLLLRAKKQFFSTLTNFSGEVLLSSTEQKIQKVVLVPKKSRAWSEYCDKRQNVEKLRTRLAINVVSFEKEIDEQIFDNYNPSFE